MVTSQRPMFGAARTILQAALVCGVLCGTLRLSGAVFINEFMAINDNTLSDEDGTKADWLELYNDGTSAVALAGWYLTDAAASLAKWQLPATNIPAGGFLLVFASDKDRRVAGAPLHTNFKLSGDGEFLGLVMPDGITIAHAYAPAFPVQVPDVSYGINRQVDVRALLAEGAPCSAFVPASAALGTAWVARTGFDDSGWLTGTTGVGYGSNYAAVVGLDVQTQLYNQNASCYVRVPFAADAVTHLTGLTLNLRYDDGCVAYLNGTRVAAANAPATPLWNSTSSASHEAPTYVAFDASTFRASLVDGTNMLALHALNSRANGPDLLVLPRLDGTIAQSDTNDLGYFYVPTPGLPNGTATTNVGPVVALLGHSPWLPAASDAIVVTARITDVMSGVASAAVRYRVMFGAEAGVSMYDDGAHGDGAAQDDCFGATIPAGAAAAGNLVRYCIVATNGAGTGARWPPWNAPEQYRGTVVLDPAVASNVPAYHVFVPYASTNLIDTDAGTLCTLFYNGELYDNVLLQRRGGWTSSQPLFKKFSHQFKFPDGHSFKYQPDAPRADNVNINSVYNDQSYFREFLCWESYRETGIPGCTAFHVQLRLNGAFNCLGLFVEQPDDDFLEHHGFDQDGALYKGQDNGTFLISTAGLVKKRPLDGDLSDLQALVSGLNSGTATDKERYAFDNVDLPELLGFVAVDLAVQDMDSKHKNYYVYRDTYGDGAWRMVGWDKDLSMGHVWDQAATSLVWNINWESDNRMHRLLFDVPVFKQMFARRARTVMDTILQAPGTPADQLYYERRIAALHDALKPLADADRAKYGWPTNIIGYFHYPHLAFDAGIHELTNNYVRPRRSFIYTTYSWWLPAPQPSNAALAFGTLDIAAASSNQHQDYIELTNTQAYAVDISGWRLTGDVAHTFAPGVVVAAGRSLFVSPDVRAFRARTRSPKAGESRFVVGNYRGQLSAANCAVTLVRGDGTLVATSIPEAIAPLSLLFMLAAARRTCRQRGVH